MMKCDDLVLTDLLDADDTETHEAEVLCHLEHCSACQTHLAHLAADQEQWDAARHWLSTSEKLNVDDAESIEAGDRWKRPLAWTDSMAESLLADASHPEMLGRVGRYDVERLIGSGGMGVVFKAYDTELNRPVAVKLLAPYLASSGAARRRFAREARAAAAVVDDHVVPIHNVETDGEHPFLVMQFIGGGSLQQRLDRKGPLEVCKVLRIGTHVAKGLAAAHAQGLIHRDVKPSNVLLDEGVERALLTDFGLARATDDASLTRSGFHPGTPHYMSPEQVRGEAIDGRSDLFGLGCVLYAMCTGHPPFRSETSYAVLRRVTDETPRQIRESNPDVPPWLELVVMKLLAKAPAERFASAGRVAELLEACLAHVQNSTATPLPADVAELDKRLGQSERKQTGTRIGGLCYRPIGRLVVAAAFALSLLFAGGLIVLESNKATRTIESEADAAPNAVPKNEVTVKAGDAHLANIAYRPADNPTTIPITPPRRMVEAIREFNNLHPADASGKRQPPLTQSEVIAVLMWKQGNGELSDELILALRSVLGSRGRIMPAGWRFVGGLVYEPSKEGAVQTWQIRLETNGLSKPVLIRKSAIAPPPSLRKPTAIADQNDTGVSLASMIDRFNVTHPEIEPRGALPRELPPLTVDEVLAAIELSRAEHEGPDTGHPTAEILHRVVTTHQLPMGSRVELITEIENSIGQWFTVESIRMVVPGPEAPGTSETIQIRHQFVGRDRNHPKSIRWSDPGRTGLQAGVRLIPAQDTYQHGDVVEIEFLYRSATSDKIAATLPPTFQFAKVRGVRLERVSFVQPKWPDGSVHKLVGNDPLEVRGHRMQICFDSNETVKPGVNLKAITRPGAAHYVRFTVPNPSDDAAGESLEIADRLFFRIPPATPPKVLPLYAAHYHQHWGTQIPGYRRSENSTPDPNYVDPFQIGVSLGPADMSRIPAYYAGGFEVTKVAAHSPAKLAGIEVGDILLAWEGNQMFGDDPSKPFAKVNGANHELRDWLTSYERSVGWGSSNTGFDLIDHQSGEVLRITVAFGQTASRSMPSSKANALGKLKARQNSRNP